MTLHSANLLEQLFGSHLKKMASMSSFTSIRVGGPADVLVEINNSTELEHSILVLWKNNIPFVLLGGCSNILVSDAGIRGLVILNRCTGIKLKDSTESPEIWAESGVMLNQLSRTAAEAGFSGMEWASLIPGTVGGAIYGNAGAHGGETCKTIVLAEILHRKKGKLSLSNEDLGFSYRNSSLKKEKGEQVILSATFRFTHSDPASIRSVVAGLIERRRSAQPQGASFGSTFRNPSGDKAGRLIEAAELKGKRIGGATISEKHGNFIINDENATAMDIWSLITLAHDTVQDKFQIGLCPEIELVGEWDQTVHEKFNQMRTAA
jgi:UDP-N-acetylmuramate dehydrogenase